MASVSAVSSMPVFPFPSIGAVTPQGSFEDESLVHADALYRTALRLTRNPADADDLVQDTYLKAFRAAARFETGSNLRAWLFTILMNTWRNRLRDAGRDPVATASDLIDRAEIPQATSGSPEVQLLNATLAPELRAALESLPETFREAVWLRDVEEFTYAEIAAMLEVPIGTVMSRISRGRRQLFERLTAGRATQRAAGAAGDTWGRGR
jgi:RNA polymerase sigma-70 factor (ECF subfamily)